MSGPVIDVQNDFRVIRVNLPETVNVTQRSSPKTEYALVIISADGQVPVFGSQELEELELDIIRVLEFIDKYVFVFLLKLFQDGRPFPEKLHDQQDLVFEIDLPSLLQQFLVVLVDLRDFQMLSGLLLVCGVRSTLDQPLRILQVVIGFDLLLFQPLYGIQQLLDVLDGITQGTVVFQGELKKMLSEKNGLLHIIQKLEIRRIPQFNAVISQHSFAKRIECADLDEGVTVRNQEVHSLFHLVGGFLSKGDGKDFLRLGKLGGDQIGDPVSDDLGFPCARPCDDEQRARSVSHGIFLDRIQGIQQLLQTFILKR
ncbi:hypothetical protein ES703_36474 [subsurface metagenome]